MINHLFVKCQQRPMIYLIPLLQQQQQQQQKLQQLQQKQLIRITSIAQVYILKIFLRSVSCSTNFKLNSYVQFVMKFIK